MKKEFKELFLHDKNIVVSDTETTGLYIKTEKELISPEITQISCIEYKIDKVLEIKEDKDNLKISFNGQEKNYKNYKSLGNNCYKIINEDNTIDYIGLINNIPVVERQNDGLKSLFNTITSVNEDISSKKQNSEMKLLFDDSIKLIEVKRLNRIYNTNNNIDAGASVVTKFVHKEKLMNLSDTEKVSFILLNYNRLKSKFNTFLSTETQTKWNNLLEENNSQKLSSLLGSFLTDFQYFDISQRDEKGEYKFPYLETEKNEIIDFYTNKVIVGHNFAGFDYSSVLKGNGIDPKSFIIDTMFFQRKEKKENRLDDNILYYLDNDLSDLKKSLSSDFSKKNKDFIEKINKIIKNLKEGRKALNAEIINFDASDLNLFITSNNLDFENFDILKNKLFYIKDTIDLVNKRLFAHGAELDVILNKYVLERKMNIYFNQVINTIDFNIKENIIQKSEGKNNLIPKGILGLKTKDSEGNITKFKDLISHLDTLPFKNYVISDSNPKNYYQLNKKMKESGYKNTLSLQMSLVYEEKEHSIEVMIPTNKTNLLLSFITETQKGFILNEENLLDLVNNSEAKVILPLELKNYVETIQHESIKLGLNIYELPLKNEIEEIKKYSVFVANNKYGKDGKILSDIVWHSVQENQKINVQDLVNLQNDEDHIINEHSITKLTEEFLNDLYYTFPEIGLNTNNILEDLEKFDLVDPVIYDKTNIFLTPKKLGLTNKEFETTEQYKNWTFENIQDTIPFTKTLSPYITALQKYVDKKKEELHVSTRDEHKVLISENKDFYNKIINEYNSKNLETIVDKFKFIKHLLDNTNDFKEYLENTINNYNERVTTELDVIFDMPGKGISNGHNLYTTQAVVNTMNDLLSPKEDITIPKHLKFVDQDKCYMTNYNYVISKMLDKTNEETIFGLLTKEQNKRAVGPGRGSAGGSLVTYNLSITDIDPIRFNLLFERFLNPERISPPDIDNDYPFSDNPKGLTIEKFLDVLENKYNFNSEELYEWLKDYGLSKDMFEKYGKTYKMIKKLGTEVEATGKSIFRRLLSVMNVPSLRINDYSATYDESLTLSDNIKKKEELFNLYCTVKNLAIDDLEGLSMNTGTAASAVMLNFISPTNNGKTIAFNKNSDGIFDNKLDILSLNTMKLILLMQRQIIKNGKVLFNYSIDDLDDKETLLNIQKGRTGVVFQIESSLMTNAVKELYPLDYQAIADTSAIQRPGPAEWAAGPYLINRRLYYKNYFMKLFHQDILKKEEISIKDIDDLYEKIKNTNSYIVVDKTDLSKGHMLNKDQFRSIMTTKPFLESGEFYQIAGLHTKNLLSTSIDNMTLKDVFTLNQFDDFCEKYETQNKGLTSIEMVYLSEFAEAFSRIPSEITENKKINQFLNKEADKKTVETLKEFETNLTKNKLYKEITDKTFGTLVYQEDIMLLVQKLGGFTIGAADILRRAISKKGYDLSSVKLQIIDNLSNQITLFETDNVKFYKSKTNHLMFRDEDGKIYNLGDTYIKHDKEDNSFSIQFTTNKIYLNNLPKELKEKLTMVNNIEEKFGNLIVNGFENIENFSELEATYLYDKMKSFAGYAFNKSHADAYTNITYITAYIKTHHENIFYNTVLRNGSLSNAQNLLREINVHNLSMIIPKVNDIDLNNTHDIIFPVSKIKSVNSDIELAINYIKESLLKKDEKIEDITFLYRNLGKKYLNKVTMQNLAKFGFFNDVFYTMQEKTISKYIDTVLLTLEDNEKNMKSYFADCISEKSSELNLKFNKTEIKNMILKYFNFKKEILEYMVEEQRNKHFEFNALELEKPSEEAFKEVELFEKNYNEICLAYWKNTEIGEYDFKIDKIVFFDTFKENLVKKLDENEANLKLNELSDNISNDNYFNEIDKQLLYTDLLKEYNFKENVVRVKTCDKKEVEKVTNEFKKEFLNIYRDKKNDSGEEVKPLKFNDVFIGETPKTLILIPASAGSINESTFGDNTKVTPKLIINGQLTSFENHDIEKDKQYINNAGNLMTTKRNVQRMYLDILEIKNNDDEIEQDIESLNSEIEEDDENEEIKDNRKYHDFVVQSNGIFYIGSHNTETFINDQGFPSLEPIFDKNGVLKNKELAEELGIKNYSYDTRKFNRIMEDLIKIGVNLNDVVIVPSSASVKGEKIDWVQSAPYLKALQKLIKDMKIKSVIPIGNEALKSIKSLNNITFAGFKTDFNYPYQFGDKLDYAIVTFVENRLAPGFEKKTKTCNDYFNTLRKVLKDEIVVDETGTFVNLYKKKTKKDVEENSTEIGI